MRLISDRKMSLFKVLKYLTLFCCQNKFMTTICLKSPTMTLPGPCLQHGPGSVIFFISKLLSEILHVSGNFGQQIFCLLD